LKKGYVCPAKIYKFSFDIGLLEDHISILYSLPLNRGGHGWGNGPKSHKKKKVLYFSSVM
jgi:hypothetical protein